MGVHRLRVRLVGDASLSRRPMRRVLTPLRQMGAQVEDDKETLPLKVWSDCVRCPKRDGCDEIAMVRFLHDVPIIAAPTAAPTPRGVSIPVLEHVD